MHPNKAHTGDRRHFALDPATKNFKDSENKQELEDRPEWMKDFRDYGEF
ncbi:MAG: hypothetical protein JSU70_02500 [Phycisphaerales bacterium]|nr:MAG: hypothetical protein JSU70_02500 [Phycisphaerales bacterium]